MRIIICLLIITAALAATFTPAAAQSPAEQCDSVRSVTAAARIEAEMMADLYHEHAVVLDCLTREKLADAVGSSTYTPLRISVLAAQNELAVHSHVLSTIPSIEDMQTFAALNVLEFRLIGYDLNAKVWSRCSFKKASWDVMWPAVDVNALYREVNGLLLHETGNYRARVNSAYTKLWTEWAADNGVSFDCVGIS